LDRICSKDHAFEDYKLLLSVGKSAWARATFAAPFRKTYPRQEIKTLSKEVVRSTTGVAVMDAANIEWDARKGPSRSSVKDRTTR
jgi:hypothetical protein